MSFIERHPEVKRFLEKMADNQRERFQPSDLQKLSPELLDIAQRAKEVTQTWNMVEITSPDSGQVQKQKKQFLEAQEKGETYVPQFEYPIAQKINVHAARENLQQLRTQVRAFQPEAGNRLARLARVALDRFIQDSVATCDVIEGIQNTDDALVKRGMNLKYRPLEPELIEYEQQLYTDALNNKAKGILSDKDKKYLEKRKFSPKQLSNFFQRVLRQYGIANDQTPDGFQVSNQPTQVMDARHRSQQGATIFLSDKPQSAKEALRLLRHELEAHARQTSNGRALFELGGVKFSFDDEAMYEGLAIRQEEEYSQEYFGDPLEMKFYARAVKLAEEGKSFPEIFQTLSDVYLRRVKKLPLDAELPKDISKQDREKAAEMAWTTTYRVMRGHTDMENREGFAWRKDLGYFYGRIMDAQLREEGYERVNEMGVLAQGGLAMLAEFDVNAIELPYPDQRATDQLLQELLAERPSYEFREVMKKVGKVALVAGVLGVLGMAARHLRK